jgi:hypothetical protein
VWGISFTPFAGFVPKTISGVGYQGYFDVGKPLEFRKVGNDPLGCPITPLSLSVRRVHRFAKPVNGNTHRKETK